MRYLHNLDFHVLYVVRHDTEALSPYYRPFVYFFIFSIFLILFIYLFIFFIFIYYFFFFFFLGGGGVSSPNDLLNKQSSSFDTPWWSGDVYVSAIMVRSLLSENYFQ